MSRMITIAGTGRSGTNILKSIFRRNSEAATLPFESRFLIDPRGIVSFYRLYSACWSPYMADFLINDLSSFLLSLATCQSDPTKVSGSVRGPYHGWELDKWIPNYSTLVNDLIEELTEFHYNASWPGAITDADQPKMRFGRMMTRTELAEVIQRFMQRISDAVCNHQQRSVFIEDNTHAILFAVDLGELLPSHLLIHVVRDPRDVIASLLEQKWTPNTVKECTVWYKNVVKKWWDQRISLHNEQYVQVQLEELVNNPETVLRELCSFCKLPFEQEMLSVQLNSSNRGRYLNDLTPEQIKFIEQETEEEATCFGYGY